MSTETPYARARPEAPCSSSGNEVGKTPSKYLTYDNERLKNPKLTSISTASTGVLPTTTTTTTFTSVYTNTIQIQYKRNYAASIRVPEKSWKAFIVKARALHLTANGIINMFIEAVINDEALKLENKTAIFNMNLNIAKAESNPVINVGDFVAEKQLDTIIAKVHALKKKAEKEQAGDTPLSFTVSRSKELEEDILRVLRGVRKLPPAKLEEVNAALTILRSIRGFP